MKDYIWKAILIILSAAITILVPLFMGYWNPFDVDTYPGMGMWMIYLEGWFNLLFGLLLALVTFGVYSALRAIFK